MSDIAEQLRAWSQSLADSVEPTAIDQVTSPERRAPTSLAVAPSSTGRPTSRRWLAVAASVAVLAAGLVGVAQLGGGADRVGPAAGPTPATAPSDDATTPASGQAPASTPASPTTDAASSTNDLDHVVLVDGESVGDTWVTAMATSDAEIASLWGSIGLSGAVPDVDFSSRVVAYFGPAESGSCRFGPLAGVSYDPASGRVFPVLTFDDGLPADADRVCTSDANPHAIVVSIDRDDLPSGDFELWVSADDPPACCAANVTRADGAALRVSDAASAPEPVAPSLLTPRSSALAVWTGAEVLVVGGEPRSTCSPGADCVAPDFASLADGAAYDPTTDTWRAISDAPRNMSGNARGLVVGDVVYVLVLDASWRPGGAGGFLAYDLSSDTWRDLTSPGGRHDRITRFGDSVVAFRGSDEGGEAPDLVYDPSADAWQPLPDDPLSPSFDRTMVEAGGVLFLFAKDLVANPGSESPSLVRAAALDPSTMTWRVRADSEILGSDTVAAIDGEIVFAGSGSADGGQVNNWGRSYPNGGIYDPAGDAWRALPAPAADPGFPIAGVFGTGDAIATAAAGHVLLTAEGRWVETPFAGAGTGTGTDTVVGRAVVATDTSIFVFGGETWSGSDPEATMSNGAAMWTPPQP